MGGASNRASSPKTKSYCDFIENGMCYSNVAHNVPQKFDLAVRVSPDHTPEEHCICGHCMQEQMQPRVWQIDMKWEEKGIEIGP